MIPYEHILEIDFQVPKTFKEGYLRLVLREGQAKVNALLDTYSSRLTAKKEAEAFNSALRERVQTAEYVTPPESAEPDQIDRQVTVSEIGQILKAGTTVQFQDLILKAGVLKRQPTMFGFPKEWPVAECEAHVETGAAISARVTAPRVVAGAMTFGSTGAVVGAIAKKDRTKVYLNIITPDEVIMKEVKGLDETKARQFANKVNNAATEHGAHPVGQDTAVLTTAPATAPPPPPPVSVPADWYPQGDIQRYWDGAVWTDHTAPLAPADPA
ncbi:DUF2510 domain-containing protein [Arthrobacter sp. CG_A4]|uniref:DUF2510 domain-containing protein n=1 Tax=Arthrobacter sp. CG_A4 TaxID=3071706 RepID=UPI002DFE42D6|nr:hypothetical protein [Arthrobacter sp. CG_A4]